MNRIRLNDLAQIAEIVAAIAVVISLVYVGRGLEDNTAAIRAASVQTMSEAARESLLAIAMDEEMSRIVRTGADEYSAISGEEKFRYGLFSRQRWLLFQGIWIQERLGVLNPELWGTYARIICSTMLQDGVREELVLHENVLDPEFIHFLHSCSP
jgi:hypothetical protein